MDSLTHLVLGGVIAETGFRGKLGGKAFLLGVAGGLLPDFDMVTGLVMSDSWVQLTAHRGMTHSLFFSPLVSLVLAWIFWRWSKKASPFGWWYLLSFLILISHLLLDCSTSYGTQVFVPFFDKRVAWNCISILDIFYTGPLLLTLLICLAVHRYWPQKGTFRIGVVGLFLTTLYIAYGSMNHHQARVRALSDAGDKGVTVLRAEAYPQLITVWVWRTVVKTPEGYLLGRTNTLLGKTVTSMFLSNDRDSLIESARALRKVRIYRWFADDLLRGQVTRNPQGGGIVRFYDMRYGNPMDVDQYLWGIRVAADRNGTFGTVERFYNRSFSPGKLIGSIIAGIRTP